MQIFNCLITTYPNENSTNNNFQLLDHSLPKWNNSLQSRQPKNFQLQIKKHCFVFFFQAGSDEEPQKIKGLEFKKNCLRSL